MMGSFNNDVTFEGNDFVARRDKGEERSSINDITALGRKGVKKFVTTVL